ncbi:hypothetical protein PGB90_001630 [Kerria lacca]
MPPLKRHFSRNNIHPTRISSLNVISAQIDESQKLRKICSTCVNEGLCDITPAHIPVPIVAFERYIITEFLIAAFGIICGFVQYFNIYQSSWWLPNSYFGLNLHLIDWFVIQFSVIMTVRPLVFSIIKKYVMQILNKFENNPNLSPCIRLNLFQILGILVHRCFTSSQRSRDEIDFLRADFNARMKCLLFNSFANAYYCVYIPACYSQGFLYFEDNWVSYYIILVWFTCICVYLTRYFSFNYYDTCHRAALHLGKWTKINGKCTPCYAWIDSIFWYKGVVVKYNGIIYKAESLIASAEPGNKIHDFFYCCFVKPGLLICWWLGLEISVVCLQFVFLLLSTEWNHILASCTMLICTYYSLYKCIKIYVLCDTFYKLEDSVQTKMIVT